MTGSGSESEGAVRCRWVNHHHWNCSADEIAARTQWRRMRPSRDQWGVKFEGRERFPRNFAFPRLQKQYLILAGKKRRLREKAVLKK
jgi:hypothetical protein